MKAERGNGRRATILAIVLALTVCGCTGPKPAPERYPVKQMLDPVTERAPDVIRN